MEKNKLSKPAIIVIVLALLSVLMVDVGFFWGRSAYHFMEEMDFCGLLMWMFYIAFALTGVCMVINHMDLAKLTAIISNCAIILTILVLFITNADITFWGRLRIGAYCLTACSIASTVIVLKAAKET